MNARRGGFTLIELLVVMAVIGLLLSLAAPRYFGSVDGKALAAIKTNETRLEYLGISAKRVFWGGYVLSAALCWPCSACARCGAGPDVPPARVQARSW